MIGQTAARLKRLFVSVTRRPVPPASSQRMYSTPAHGKNVSQTTQSSRCTQCECSTDKTCPTKAKCAKCHLVSSPTQAVHRTMCYPHPHPVSSRLFVHVPMPTHHLPLERETTAWGCSYPLPPQNAQHAWCMLDARWLCTEEDCNNTSHTSPTSHPRLAHYLSPHNHQHPSSRPCRPCHQPKSQCSSC